MTGSVHSLRAATAHVRAEVEAPYAIIACQSAQLAALHTSAEVLRHVLHHLKLVARLKAGSLPTLHLWGGNYLGHVLWQHLLAAGW